MYLQMIMNIMIKIPQTFKDNYVGRNVISNKKTATVTKLNDEIE